MRGSRFTVALAVGLCALAACRQDMHDQPKGEPLEHSRFFADGRYARPLVADTVARENFELDAHLLEGKLDGKPADSFPFEITRADLDRGRERYDIFCAPCHDAAGTGNGMIVQRGMKAPPSMHVERLRAASPGYHFDVITRGFGAMFDYADRIEPRDRWRIVAYVRALQLSQNGQLTDLPPAAREALEAK